jgi:hypothetical protein
MRPPRASALQSLLRSAGYPYKRAAPSFLEKNGWSRSLKRRHHRDTTHAGEGTKSNGRYGDVSYWHRTDMPAVLSDVRCLPTTVKSAFCYSLLVCYSRTDLGVRARFCATFDRFQKFKRTSFMIIAGVFTV